MTDIVLQRNVGSLVSNRLASAFNSATAGGTGDNTAVTGSSIDRVALNLPSSAVLTILWTATLAAAATLTLKTVKIQDSADGSTFADFITYTDPGVVATGPGGGGTVKGQTNLAADLSGARRYVRALFTPDLSAANTDTSSQVVLFTLAGESPLPAA